MLSLETAPFICTHNQISTPTWRSGVQALLNLFKVNNAGQSGGLKEIPIPFIQHPFELVAENLFQHKTEVKLRQKKKKPPTKINLAYREHLQKYHTNLKYLYEKTI